ncbi:hypothetical protein E4L95_04245 [Paracoccus liaowanqingii]|uniref:Uncharacterized protein n=1 Tax=Paracoccus liaowanqingii TaxID=2560053 RepID=A0A4Z1CRL2_9RHOB|nr:hypothetical protein [Paracoccus liaowanqingii]TGN67629.1 hypothetical protein E4L95_04245 [Paracoccus liaowanqingii]
MAERNGISEQTVWEWRSRDSVYDRSHTAHRLQTTPTLAPEVAAVTLRKSLLLSLDGILSVGREILNPNVMRSKAGPMFVPAWRGKPACAEASPATAYTGSGTRRVDDNCQGAHQASHPKHIGSSPMASGKEFTDRLFSLRRQAPPAITISNASAAILASSNYPASRESGPGTTHMS